jgi:transposase
MTQAILGIDIAKATYYAHVLVEGKRASREFRNVESAFPELTTWLHKHGVAQVHACMEATGRYGDELAHFLHRAGHQVSIVNPMQIKAFARSQLRRNKTDKLDAEVIADFCLAQHPLVWTPTPPAMRELQEFLRHYDDLQQALVQTKNRLQAGVKTKLVREQLQSQQKFLEDQVQKLKQQIRDHLDSSPDLKNQQELLESIPGIGEITAARLVSLDLLRFATARTLASYAGVTPMQRTSGTSVRGKPSLSKIGDATLRQALYLPAMAAIRHNPPVRQLAERLRKQGKCEMLIIGAGMHKLLTLAFGVVKSGLPFDPNYATKSQAAA